MIEDSKKGMEGGGMMIIFISLVLVAAIGAVVLLQTASSLQTKSLDVSRGSRDRITIDVEIIQAFAVGTEDGEITGGVDNITIVVRCGSGSTPIRFRDTVVKFDGPNGAQALTFGNSSSTTHYSVKYLTTGVNHVSGYLSKGEIAQLNFVALHDFGEAKKGAVRIVMNQGAVRFLEFTTPSAMIEDSISLI